jgi:hypothetical protein
LNLQALTCTAANFEKLLRAYGHDDEAVRYMQDGLNGFRNNGHHVPTPANLVDGPQKQDLMADFRAGSGVFAPQMPPPDAMKEIRDLVRELTGRVGELEKKLALQGPAQTSAKPSTPPPCAGSKQSSSASALGGGVDPAPAL